MSLDPLTLDDDALTLDADALQLYDVDVVVTEQEGSSLAKWSYTAPATHWALTGRDDWTREATYAAPVAFLCDYKAESVKAMDAEGEEFTARLVVYTGRADIKRGDYILIGTSTAASPIGVDGAREVRSVTQYADTFERLADDYTLQTI
jgi:hypothetical protein